MLPAEHSLQVVEVLVVEGKAQMMVVPDIQGQQDNPELPIQVAGVVEV